VKVIHIIIELFTCYSYINNTTTHKKVKGWKICHWSTSDFCT